MRYSLSILLLSTVTALSSCSMSVDPGSCPESRATLITGLGQTTLLSQSDAQQGSGLVQFNVIETSQPVSADRFMIAITADAQFVASEINSPSSLIARIGNFFVSDAIALSCIGPEFVSQQPLQGITITSNAAVSAQYPAGSDLAAVFRVGKQTVSAPEYSTANDSIVARAPEDRESIPEYLSTLPQVPLLLAMTLDVEEPIASQHVFAITYTLDDGNIFTIQTEPVNIIP